MADADGRWTGITREQFIQALESLPADFREVFELRAGGHAYDQIAARMAISREVVSANLRQARTLLRGLLLPARSA
jgi:RNA polymerase sigma factor (sigma-70 family)